MRHRHFRRTPPRFARPAAVESLEDRRLLIATVTIDNVTEAEGSSVEDNVYTFTVTRSGTFSDLSQATNVNFTTGGGSATAGDDYTPQNGTITFEPLFIITEQPGGLGGPIAPAAQDSATTETIVIIVDSDTEFEPDETFNVVLSNATNATITDGTGVGTIQNDDTPPPTTYEVDDVTISEGNSGTKNAVFTVRRGGNTITPSTIVWQTRPGTAVSDGQSPDFNASQGNLAFAQGETSKTISVTIRGDTAVEPDETFTLALLAAQTGGEFDTATGTITNDDAPPVPEVGVSLQGGGNISDGQTPAISFGTVALGDPDGASRTFVVSNSGNARLTLGTLSVPSGYDVTSSLASVIEPGQSDTFTVALSAGTVGTRSGSISFTTNDSSEATFNFPVTGTVEAPDDPAVPEVTVGVQGGSALTSGQSAAIAFGSVELGDADGPTVTFVVTNDGEALLTLGTPTLPTGFTLTSGLSTSLAPGASDTFTVALASNTIGAKSGSIRITTNDASENPFTFPVTGTVVAVGVPAAPEIAIALVDVGGTSNTPLSDGLGTPVDFGQTPIGQASAERAFVVTNTGDAPLTAVSLGTIPIGYEVVDPVVATLAPGESDTFTLRLSATAPAGMLAGAIAITSNDADENPFDISLAGRVNAPVLGPVATFLVDGVAVVPGQSIDFGSRAANAIATIREIVVRNDGNAPLDLGAIKAPEGFTLVEPQQPVTVAPGATATVKLSFSATTPGSFAGAVPVATNDPAANPFTLNLTGDATPAVQSGPPATVIVTSFDAAKLPSAVVAGDPKAKAPVSLTLRNDGTTDFNGPVAIAINASLDGILDDGDGKALLSMTKTMKIKAGATAGVKLTLPLGAIPQGAQIILASATASEGVSTFTGPGVNVAQPFVSLSAPPISPGPKKPLKFGKRGLFTLALENTGNVPTTAGPVTYSLVVSPDTTEAAGVFNTTASAKVKLKAGTIKPQKLKVTFPAGSFAPGQYFLLVKLNADLNQTNGQVLTAIPFTIQ